MCFELRKTASRGRSVVPNSLLRVCLWRRSRRTWTSFRWLVLTVPVPQRVSGRPMPTGRPARHAACHGLGHGLNSLQPTSIQLLRAERLAGLAADDLALVADPFALVRLGGAD